MVRPLRVEFEGAVYHITSRGNAGNDVYVSDRDRRIFEACRLHGYTLFQIQEHLGLHYSTISRIAKLVAEEGTSKNKT